MSEENLAPVLADGDGISARTETSPVSHGSVGHRLREAREARGASINEVAAALKLSPRQVAAMEGNDWSSLPRTVIRGFVRNYARYLGEEATSFLEGLDGQPLVAAPELKIVTGAPVSMPREGHASRQNYLLIISGLVVLVFAVLVYYLLPTGWLGSGIEALQGFISSKTAAETSDSPASPPVPTILEQAPSPAAEVHTPPVPELLPQAAPPIPAAAAATPAATTQSSSVSAGHERLAFSFAQSSWVEVRDRSGQVVFSQLSPAGSQREVSGQPPFSLVIGNASRVTLQYKGKPVDLSKRSKDDVVRLTLE